jgi:hypothetical protein
MYAKVFEGLLTSSLWCDEPDHVLRVFLTLLLKAQPEDGHVDMVESALAGLARVTPAKCRDAIQRLEAPDLNSKSQEYGGARIARVPRGWIIINYKKYRDYRTKSQMQAAERQQRKRLREKDLPMAVADAARDMSVTSRDVTPSTSASASASVSEVGGPGEGPAPDVSPDVSPAPDLEALSPLAAIVATPQHLHAVTTLRRAHRHPAEFDRALEELLVLGWTGETLGAALVDLLRTGARFSPDTVVAFAKRIATRGPRSATPPRPAVAIVSAAPVPPEVFCDECGGELVERPGMRRMHMVHKTTCSRWKAA